MQLKHSHARLSLLATRMKHVTTVIPEIVCVADGSVADICGAAGPAIMRETATHAGVVAETAQSVTMQLGDVCSRRAVIRNTQLNVPTQESERIAPPRRTYASATVGSSDREVDI
uniref:Uncharacterized protein n=1 Tax=Mycobacterium sp. (strain KMS) TaxID=189918 RepID=A1ULW9_MYCSK